MNKEKIQFHHNRNYDYCKIDFEDYNSIIKILKAKGGTTIALQIPTLEQFNNFKITELDHWGFYDTIELEAGLAKCSSEDNYNKKLGRNIATGRMENLVFWARKHKDNEVILVATNGKFPELYLRKEKYPDGNETIRFIGIK